MAWLWVRVRVRVMVMVRVRVRVRVRVWGRVRVRVRVSLSTSAISSLIAAEPRSSTTSRKVSATSLHAAAWWSEWLWRTARRIASSIA